ncbi:hypothetical protein LPJ73_004236 [Coemansia sp. RSA 2703]|nr:hypothetical protein LPJ73_004236 [Coemansia sp. RSA 2703]KAJ2371603.1 hypothetical protein IW150_004518 [Coemansia sp. RSA 2607]
MEPGSKRKVLSEEKYKSALSQIIERDFFPDLRRLQAERQALLQTSISPLKQPADTPPAETIDQSLDQFLSSHVSEDTASFRRLFDAETAKRKEKRAQLLGARKANLLHGNEQHTGLIKGPAQTLFLSCGSSEKSIAYENTRFSDKDGVWGDFDDCESVAGSEMTVDGDATPVINGYRMVSSPSVGKRAGFVIRPETPRERVARQAAGGGGGGRKRSGDEKAGRGMLSPAGQRLLGRASKGARPGGSSPSSGAADRGSTASGDDMLRRAYNSPYARRGF